jgi:hypothetical protein
MKQFLIEFRADYYCQGYEEATFQVLTFADSFEKACEKIKSTPSINYECETAHSFKNLTVL